MTSFPISATLTAMFYYLHLLLLAPIYSMVPSLFLRDQNRESLLLRQQLLILQRQYSREEPSAIGCIRSRQVLGGLINDYYQEAA